MRIRKVTVNNKKKCLEIETAKGPLALPYSRLRAIPTPENRINEAYVDKELGNEAVTYILESGEEDSIHVDAFLDYNKDPDYMTKLNLYKLTLKALELVEKSKVSKREIARRLRTSPGQLYRLLNTANYSKSIDLMIKLLFVLGCEVGFMVKHRIKDQRPVKTGERRDRRHLVSPLRT